MKHAIQLAIKLPILELCFVDLPVKYTYERVQKYGKNFCDADIEAVGVCVKTLPTLIQDIILSTLPKSLLAVETPEVVLMEFHAHKHKPSVVAPHVDLNRCCGINFYLEVSGGITSFYRWDKQSKSCFPEQSICANQGDVWILNTSVPHSVEIESNTVRRMISCSFVTTSFHSVVEELKRSKYEVS